HYFHSTVAQAFIAGATERIRIMSSVSLLPLQHPIIMAKALSTADWLSNGRITATFGVGWDAEEFKVLASILRAGEGGLRRGSGSRMWPIFPGFGVVGPSRVAGLSGLPGPGAFRGRWGSEVAVQPKAVRMFCQAVAIAAAHRQVVSMRSRSWRAPRVMRAATCRTR